jgi:hypothetical protein
MEDIHLLTSSDNGDPDTDREPLLEAILAAGGRARWVEWDAVSPEEVRNTATGLWVLRATWNYHHDLPRFLNWVSVFEDPPIVSGGARVARGARLLNGPAVVRWNADKHYLGELDAAGIAIVPTRFVDRAAATPILSRGQAVADEHFAELVRTLGSDDLVIKPTVSAGSKQTGRFRFRDRHCGAREAEDHLAQILEQGDAMVQPYMAQVADYGERNLVVLNGQLSHAVRKSPRFSADEESTIPVPIASDEAHFARRIIDWLNERFVEPILYARVDTIRDDNGQVRLMELELIEPSLFLKDHPAALHSFAKRLVQLSKST